MPKTIERSSAVDLAVASPAPPDDADAAGPGAFLPWVAAALLGSAATVLLGWLVVAATVTAGWLTVDDVPPAAVLETIGEAWVGIHGVPFTVAGLTVGLTPLGLTALVAVAMGAVARFVVGQRDATGGGLGGALLVAATCTLSYALPTLVVATLVGTPRQAASALVGALGASGVGSLVGAIRACGVRLPWGLAAWLRGVVAGTAALAAASAVTLVLAVVSHQAQMAALGDNLAPDAVGAVLLVVVDAAYLPTLLLWSGAYALGAGITVGTGTLLTPGQSVLGLVPGLPIAGALPSVPPAYGWIFWAVGPACGLVAGLVAVAAVADTRHLPTRGAVVGGLAGLGAGLIWVAASWLSRGDLGTGRLVGLGPRFPDLLAYALVPLTLGGVLAGVAYALVKRRADGDETALPDAAASEV